MRIAIGADHAGYEAKERLKRRLGERGVDMEDVGTHGTASVDYPDFAARVSRLVAAGKADVGVLVCGSGIGMSIAANKVKGIRAAHCTDSYTARLAREHNDANVLCMGSRVTGPGLMEEVLDVFLNASFQGGRHANRVDKVMRLEATEPGEPRIGC
ncbi:MAG: ribose 5-phosphate isomerase B [Acidobacteriia bacterium]|nr:ribose 5-phosphate isomerase B [Terriglobia bacterium]